MLSEHHGEVLFEVDYQATASRHGWSVLVRGTCAPVTDPATLTSQELAQLVPWAARTDDLVVRLRTEQITGRRADYRS